MTRTAPAWFVQKLKALNPHFGVMWDERQHIWAITEAVRHSKLVGEIDGAPVYRLRRRAEPALRFKELGDRVFTYIRRNNPKRYLSVPHMVEALGIDKGERPKIQETLVAR